MVSWEHGVCSENNHFHCIFQCTKLPCSHEVSAVLGKTLSLAVRHSGSWIVDWCSGLPGSVSSLRHLPMLLMNKREERHLKVFK